MDTSNNRLIGRICMVILLFAGVTYSFLSEQIPLAGGAGWDGEIYRDMSLDFIGMWKDGQISSYYIQKCLPFALVNVINTIFGIMHPLRTLIVLHYIAVLMAIIAFFKTSSYLQLKPVTEWIAYALTFWQLGIIKSIGYYPYSGDFFAYAIALWMFYFFVSKQKYKMLGVAILGAFVWQSMLLIALILFILPDKGYNMVDGINMTKWDKIFLQISKTLVLLAVALIPITILLYAKSKGGLWMWSQVIPFCFFALPKWVLAISTLSLLILFYYVLKPFNFSISELIKYTISNVSWKHVVVAIVVFVCFKFGIRFLSNPSLDSPVSAFNMLKRVLWEPYAIPLKFFSTHLATCGLLLPLFMILYRPILRFVSEHSIGYITALIMLMILGLQSETRFILNFFPFVVFAISKVLDSKELKLWAFITMCVLQFLFSCIWYHFNVPGLLAAFETYDSWDYVRSDIAQRYFFFFGPWQGLKAYAIYMSIFVIMMTTLYVGKNREWFVKC